MSFPIVLMENTSPTNKVGKNLTTVETVTGTLRNGTSILDPEILVESALSSDMLSRVNYARIELWHRYYYVTDMTLDVTGLWLLAMHVDVLETYKQEISSQNCIVARQEHKYNMYFDDGWFMSYQNPIVNTPFFSAAAPFEQQSFILVVAGS